jgi:2-polyprenyl-6-methoxyphenol hydroxylase-like FAD-dependent oxidoreductase
MVGGMTTSPEPVHDVVVVGGRAAGAATAMLLARQGHDVVVVDRSEPGSDQLSTHSIARSGVVLLQRWGLLDEVLASGAPPIRQVAFTHVPTGERIVRTVRSHAGVDLVVAPRRHVLDALLVRAAVSSGAEVRQPTTVESLVLAGDGQRVAGVVVRDSEGRRSRLRARYVVGADGVRSTIARAVGAPVLEDRGPGGTTLYAYFAGPWSGTELVVGDHLVGGVFPTHFGEAAVWVCAPSDVASRLRLAGRSPLATFDELVDRLGPGLRGMLDDARRTSPVRSASGLPNHRLLPHGPGWALVGDAGYHRDPITGHGLTDAFRDAQLLAEALDAALRGCVNEPSALAAFHDARDERSQAVFDLTCQLAALPAADEVVALQRALSVAIDAESASLATGEPLFPTTTPHGRNP